MLNTSQLIRRLALPVTRLHIPYVSAQISRTVERYCADRQQSCAIRGNHWELDLNELIDHRIYYLGAHERFTTKRILDSLPVGGVFFDVGANIGYFTVLAAKKVGPSGHVHAFEPMGRAYDKLVRHVELNQLHNVTSNKVVLTNQPCGPIVVAFQSSWRLYDRLDEPAESESIATTTLDEYVASQRLTRVDALKIDVDGYEYKVMSGGKDLVKRFRPRIIIELGKSTLSAAGDSLEALLDLLSSAGYQLFNEVTMRPFASLREVRDRVPAQGTINAVCIAGRF